MQTQQPEEHQPNLNQVYALNPNFETQNMLMLPHRLILFHRAQEATWKPNPKPSLKPRGRLMSHVARKPNRTPHLKPPWRQQKTWNPPKIPQNQHQRRPLHPTTGRQQQLSNLTTNPQPWQPPPHHKSTRAPNPPTSNQPSLLIRHP